MGKTAIISLQVSIDASLENAFVDFLKGNRFPEYFEQAFLQKHNLSISQFVTLQRTFYQMIFEIEAAQVPPEPSEIQELNN
jgi:Ni,Fe-hydrogenase maturation factor